MARYYSKVWERAREDTNKYFKTFLLDRVKEVKFIVVGLLLLSLFGGGAILLDQIQPLFILALGMIAAYPFTFIVFLLKAPVQIDKEQAHQIGLIDFLAQHKPES